jgi:PTS system nitrogen regulatory IIA component
VAFDAPDGKPVSVLIFLLVPEQATQHHLELLSEVAEMLSDTRLRDSLFTLSDASLLHQVISTWQPASA